jgi:hypothetical protein
MTLTGEVAAEAYLRRYAGVLCEADEPIIDLLREGYVEFDTSTELMRLTPTGAAYHWCLSQTMN